MQLSKPLRASLIAFFGAAALSACTDNAGAREALTEAGFTEIETTGYKIFACGRDDTYTTGFRARNPQGQVVTGTVCSGFFLKGSTIHY